MGLVALWLVAGTMVASAIIFGWATLATRPMAADLARRIQPGGHEELVRLACADIDDEYRQLLNH